MFLHAIYTKPGKPLIISFHTTHTQRTNAFPGTPACNTLTIDSNPSASVGSHLCTRELAPNGKFGERCPRPGCLHLAPCLRLVRRAAWCTIKSMVSCMRPSRLAQQQAQHLQNVSPPHARPRRPLATMKQSKGGGLMLATLGAALVLAVLIAQPRLCGVPRLSLSPPLRPVGLDAKRYLPCVECDLQHTYNLRADTFVKLE